MVEACAPRFRLARRGSWPGADRAGRRAPLENSPKTRGTIEEQSRNHRGTIEGQSRNNRGHHAVSWPVTGCYVAPAWLRPGASVRCLARAGWSAARRACETDLESFGDAVAVGQFADVGVLLAD